MSSRAPRPESCSAATFWPISWRRRNSGNPNEPPVQAHRTSKPENSEAAGGRYAGGVSIVVVEHRDRPARMNAELVEAALFTHGRSMVVLDDGEGTDDSGPT